MKKILLLIPIIFIFCGCTDYKELNNIAIVTGLSIDKEGEDYKVSILISNSQKADESSKEGNAGTIVYDGKGKNMSMAMKKIDNKVSKQIYLGHLAVVIVSEKVAIEGLDTVTDYLYRSPETTKRFYLIMTRGDDKANEVLKILSPLETFPSQNVKLNIENANNTSAISDNLTYSKFVETYLKKGMEPYLPTIEIYGNEKKGSTSKALESADLKAYTSLKGLALFKDSNFVGYASENESRGINLALGNTTKMIIETKCDDGYIVTAINNIKTKTRIKFENNNPIIYINVDSTGNIQEVTCNLNFYDEETIKDIEKKTEKKMKYLINKGLDKTKKLETDVYGFGNLVYKNNPKYFNSIYDWNKKFKNIKVKIKVSVNIKSKGSINQSIKAAKYEDS